MSIRDNYIIDPKVAIIFPIVIVMAIVLFYFNFGSVQSVFKSHTIDKGEIDDYFNSHNFEFAGVIDTIFYSDHDMGMLVLTLSSSNTEYYSPFATNENCYYCYIDGKYAEVYKTLIGRDAIGDSIYVSCEKNLIQSVRRGKENYEYRLSVNSYKDFYLWAAGHHKDPHIQ